MDNKETKKDVPLATEIIRTLKKIIFALIITNVLTVGGFLWYISLPVDVGTDTTTVNSEDNGTANYINESNVGDINNGKDNSAENGN